MTAERKQASSRPGDSRPRRANLKAELRAKFRAKFDGLLDVLCDRLLLEATGKSSPHLLSVASAAALLGFGKSTVWTMIQRGQLETIKIGGRTFVRPETIEKLVKGEATPRKSPGSGTGAGKTNLDERASDIPKPT
jgi:excisionase family DNA binding protein